MHADTLIATQGFRDVTDRNQYLRYCIDSLVEEYEADATDIPKKYLLLPHIEVYLSERLMS